MSGGGFKLHDDYAADGIGLPRTGDKLHYFQRGQSTCGLVGGAGAPTAELAEMLGRYDFCRPCVAVSADRGKRALDRVLASLSRIPTAALVDLQVVCAKSDPLSVRPPRAPKVEWQEARIHLGDVAMRRAIWARLSEMDLSTPS